MGEFCLVPGLANRLQNEVMGEVARGNCLTFTNSYEVELRRKHPPPVSITALQRSNHERVAGYCLALMMVPLENDEKPDRITAEFAFEKVVIGHTLLAYLLHNRITHGQAEARRIQSK